MFWRTKRRGCDNVTILAIWRCFVPGYRHPPNTHSFIHSFIHSSKYENYRKFRPVQPCKESHQVKKLTMNVTIDLESGINTLTPLSTTQPDGFPHSKFIHINLSQVLLPFAMYMATDWCLEDAQLIYCGYLHSNKHFDSLISYICDMNWIRRWFHCYSKEKHASNCDSNLDWRPKPQNHLLWLQHLQKFHFTKPRSDPLKILLWCYCDHIPSIVTSLCHLWDNWCIFMLISLRAVFQ